jgi:hypothetical protein
LRAASSSTAGSGRPRFPDEQRFHLKDVFMSVLMDDTAHIRDSKAFAPGLTTYRFRQNSTALQLTGPSLGQLRLTIAADTSVTVLQEGARLAEISYAPNFR